MLQYGSKMLELLTLTEKMKIINAATANPTAETARIDNPENEIHANKAMENDVR